MQEDVRHDLKSQLALMIARGKTININVKLKNPKNRCLGTMPNEARCIINATVWQR